MFPRKRFVVFLFNLLLLAGQVASLVHATEHPFHDDSQICESFISMEHHVATASAIVLTSDPSFCAEKYQAGQGLSVYASNLNFNYARGPPLTT